MEADIILQELERQFLITRLHEDACQLLQYNFELGNIHLESLAKKYDIAFDDAWDCIREWEIGYTRKLKDAIRATFSGWRIDFSAITERLWAKPGSNKLATREGAALKLFGPPFESRIDNFSRYNEYYFGWNNIDYPWPRLTAAALRLPETTLMLEDNPNLHGSYPFLTLAKVPYYEGGSATSTASIYIKSLEEIPLVVSTLIRIAHVINNMGTAAPSDIIATNFLSLEEIIARLDAHGFPV